MTFIRRKEDFSCENCGFNVVGNGFTNHCPKCLFSKHVDIEPGDRKSICKGLMKPEKVENVSHETIIIHKCSKCGLEKRNKMSKNDEFDSILKINFLN